MSQEDDERRTIVAQTKVDPDLDPGIDGNSRGATKTKVQLAVSPGKRKAWVDAILKGGIDPHVHSGRAEGIAGVPVVAGAFSGIHVIAVWSYLYPGAFFNASFVVFMTGYHLLLSLVLNWTELKGTATSLSSIPRNPPTPTISTAILPSRSRSTSMISPTLASDGS